MQLTTQTATSAPKVGLNEIVPMARQLPTLDRLKLIRILAEDLEAIGDIFPFRAGATYELPTPYGTVGAAAMLAEAMASYDVTGDGDE
jgi:hypothetical protein